MKSLNLAGVFTIAIAILFLFGINSVFALEAEPKDDKVAVVNGSVISQQDFDVSFKMFTKELSTKADRELTENELSQVKGDILEKMIDQKLLYQAAKKDNTQIDEEAYQKSIEQLEEQMEKNPALKAEIEKTHYSMEDIHDQIRENLTVNQFLQQTFFEPAEISDEEVKKYYDQNKEKFLYPEKIRAKHILIKSTPEDDQKTKDQALKQIRMIKKKLKDGQDFEDLAEEFSQGPSSKRGGDLGFFTRGQMVPAFEEAAFALDINEVSDVVETPFGFHLIKLTARVAETTIEYDQVKEKLKNSLKKEKAKENVQSFLEDAKQSGSIELFLNN